MYQRLLKTALAVQHHAEIAVGFRVIRFDPQSVLQVFRRIVCLRAVCICTLSIGERPEAALRPR